MRSCSGDGQRACDRVHAVGAQAAARPIGRCTWRERRLRWKMTGATETMHVHRDGEKKLLVSVLLLVYDASAFRFLLLSPSARSARGVSSAIIACIACTTGTSSRAKKRGKGSQMSHKRQLRGKI